MDGRIINFRRGKRTMKGNQMVVEVPDMNKEKASKLIGKKVIFKTSGDKEIGGKVTGTHGNSGAIKVTFIKGMPGQSVGQKVQIVE